MSCFIVNEFVFLSNIYNLVWQTTNNNIYRTNSLLNMVEIIPYIIKHSFNVTVQGFLVYSCIENLNNPLHSQLSYLQYILYILVLKVGFFINRSSKILPYTNYFHSPFIGNNSLHCQECKKALGFTYIKYS